MQDMLLVLDFDHRYTAAVARKLRVEGIFCRILPGDSLPGQVQAMSPMGILLAGGVGGEVPKALDGRILNAGIPVLALGDTAASVCLLLNGSVGERQERAGVDTIKFAPSPLTEDMSESERLLVAIHPLDLTSDLSPIAYAENHVIGFRHNTLPIYALGFQIESNDLDGTAILLRFAKNICGCSDWWNESVFISNSRGEIAAEVGEGTAICAMTGGLNSGVSATLAHRALGERLRCVFVETGLLRDNEANDFLAHYRDVEGLNITVINAQDTILGALGGLRRVEQKVEVLTIAMKDILRDAVASLEYTAVIRGVTRNDLMDRGAEQDLLPDQGKKIIAPLSEFFKEEVRYIGEKLGMPPEITGRQPFPGTGLALRIEGEVTPQRLETLRTADSIFVEEIRQIGLHKKLWKYYAIMQLNEPEESIGDTIGLRAVSLVDAQLGGVRALPARLPYDLLEKCVERILRACPEVSRVEYDITPGGKFLDAR